MLSHNTLAHHALTRRNATIRPWLLVLAGTVLMTLCARISFHLPWNPLVPITMQTFGALLIGALYGPRLGAATIAAYILEAMLGLPVLAGGTTAWAASTIPGLPVAFGPTAGYLYAMPAAAALVGWLATRSWDRKVATALGAMLLGTMVILVAGFAWLLAAISIIKGGAPNMQALFSAAVLPFIPGDLIKVALAAVALPGGWALLGPKAGR